MLDWKLSSFFVILCVASYVSAQTEIAQITEIRKYNTSQLVALTNQFNLLRDDVYGHFFRSKNALRVARDNLHSAGQRFPYFYLSNHPELRNYLSGNITIFLANVSDPVIEYLQKNSTLGFFNYQENNTTPIEVAIKPISDALWKLAEAINQTTHSCLANITINPRKLGNYFTPAVNQISNCIRTTFTAYRTPIAEFTRLHFMALPLFNKLASNVISCGTPSASHASCVMKVTESMCNNGTSVCAVANSLQAVSNQAKIMVTETQAIYNTCLQSVGTKIDTSKLQQLINDIQSCTAGNSVISFDEILLDDAEIPLDVPYIEIYGYRK